MIRKAIPSDHAVLVKLAIEALEIDAYEELLISEEKISRMMRETLSSAAHFAWVSEIDGKVVGAIGALVFPMMMYERSQATIVMWYCKQGGDGMKLMAKLVEWVKSRPIIKQVHYHGERKGDPKILRVLESRYGFKSDVPFLYRNR